jgi:hypothetical protein
MLPACFTGASACEELISRLQSQSPAVAASCQIPGNAIAPGDSSLSHAIAGLLFAPSLAVKETSQHIHSVILGSAAAVEDVGLLQATVQSVGYLTAGAILYFLLDVLFLSGQRERTCADFDEHSKLWGAILGLPPRLTAGFLALWKIDSRVSVSGAVELLVNDCTEVPSDDVLLAAAMRRLVTTDSWAESDRLLSYLIRRNHRLMSEELGILARAVSIPQQEHWKVCLS